VSLSQAYESTHKHDAQRLPTTTPPVQVISSPPSQNASASQTHSEGKDANKTLVPPSALSASALGFGGPGDWEHFGLSAEDESVDDTALTTKKEEPVTQAQNNMAELPSNSSPIMSKTARQDSHEPEAWPSPPAPVPLATDRTFSTSANAAHDGTRYAPTPPPNVSVYPRPERTTSVVSVEDHERDSSIDGAMQTWARQQSQFSQHPKQEANSQHAPLVSNANQTFVMDDGGFPSPSRQNISTIVPPDRERSRTPTQALYPQQQRPQAGNKPITPALASQSFVMDDSFSSQLQQNEPIVSVSTSQPSKPTTIEVKASAPLPSTSQSFTVDDGGWSNQTLAHEPTVIAQPPEKPRGTDQKKSVPVSSQSFVVDDGGGGWPAQVQQPNSPTKTPSFQRPPDTTSPKPASTSNLILGGGPLSSQTLQRNDTSSNNIDHSQPSPKKRATPEPVDPFPNLDPWYKASLERYAAMVNAESSAATDEERTKLFTDFMIEESRLRGVRYGVGIGVILRDDEKRKSSESSISAGRAQPTTPPRGRQLPKPVSTSMPPNGSDDDIQYSPGGRPRIRSQSAAAKARNPAGVSDLRHEPVSRKSQPTTTPPPQKYAVAAPPKPIDQPLSPGRNAPILIESTESMSSRTTVHTPSSPPGKSGGIRSRPITPGSPKSTGSAPDNKPAYIPFRPGTEGPKATTESLYKPYIPPSTSLAHVTENRSYSQASATTNVKSNKPVYVPFAPPPVDASSGSYSNARGPPIQRKTSLDSASQRPRAGATNEHTENPLWELGNGKAVAYGKAATSFPRRRDTTDIATVRNTVGPVKEHFGPLLPPSAEKGEHSAGKKEVPTPSQGGDLVAGLQWNLPSNRGPKADGSIYISPTIKCMDSLPDELNFISDAISAWEIKAKKVREAHDRERRIRQEEQEEHTDQLFSENQIGYGDISALEEDFKLSEREKKSKEDREEYESFVSEVFSRSYDHFQEEIKQLMDHYVGCMDLMKDTVAGKEALEAYNDKPNLSQIMTVFVALHKKIEMRHEAVVQVVMERDKRFKKTVIQPLYSAGNIPEVKKMEKHFDEADKKSALEAARKKDQRAKRFMRSIEENTMKTLREDLNYMDEIAQEVHKILQALPPSPSANHSGIAQALSDELAFAQAILKTLASKSEDLMQSFHTAALEINAAEYGVSHAVARLNNESSDTMDRLREDMLKENDRLAKELENRISVVKGDFQRSNEEILTLLQRLEKFKVVDTAAEQGVQGSPNVADPDHDIRMVKALEAAKKRNAGKGGGPEDFS
jgi:hypothetical protein